ncbi:MAG: cell division protein FtsX [Flavobacteriaceae bacterium]|nr:MAG: FtsX-like permease family protein [Flavobacteriales bacterium]
MTKSKNNRFFSNYFLVIVSLSIVLLFLSSFLFTALNSEKIINEFKEKIPVVVFIKSESKKIEIIQFEKNLNINNNIKSFEFVSKEDAASSLSEDLGENFIDYLGYNPLYDSYNIFFTAENVNTIYIDQLVNEFENENFIQEVSYDLPLIELINTNIQVLNRWLVFLGSAFFLLSIILMNNTIRLSVYSNRLIIKTMQLVGATKSFIKKPFIFRQLTLGLCSWLLSSIIFLGLLYYLKNNFYDFSFKNIAESLAISGLISFLVCIIISYVSTSIITGKFINSKIDNLY